MTATDELRQALDTQRTVEITTTGRRTGRPRRIETWRYRADGRYWLTGSPGSRDWYANLLANPDFTLHLHHRDDTEDPSENQTPHRSIAKAAPHSRWGRMA